MKRTAGNSDAFWGDAPSVNAFLFFATAATGAIVWFFESFPYRELSGSSVSIWLIATLFAVLYAATMIVVRLDGVRSGSFCKVQGKNHWYTSNAASVAVLVLGGLLVFAMSAAFEWIYELEIECEEHAPTSYVFLIDDSGSMKGNDPDQCRFSAVGEVLEGSDASFPYAVYTFSSDVERVRDMGPASDGLSIEASEGEGDTNIKAALNRIISDFNQGDLPGGCYPRVILLTDGYASDVGYFDTLSSELRGLSSSGISVSAIALGSADEELLARITRATGGVLLLTPDAEGIAEAMKDASMGQASRDLLSERYYAENDALYAAMRILFLSILGTIIGLFCIVAYGPTRSNLCTALCSIIGAVAGAVMMEVGICVFSLPSSILWMAFWIIVTSTLVLKDEGFSSRTASAGPRCRFIADSTVFSSSRETRGLRDGGGCSLRT